MVRCAACQTLRKIPTDPSKPLTAYYEDAYADSSYWEHEHEQGTVAALEKILRAVTDTLRPQHLSLLDIGCGPGVFLSLAKAAGFDVVGLELNPALAERARQRTGAEIIIGDFMTADFQQRRFDAITLLDLIEHLEDPVSALKRCHELLKPGGHLIVYTPNHKSLIVRIADLIHRLSGGRLSGPVHEIFDGVHVVFFDVDSLAQAFRRADLRVAATTMLRYDPSRSGQAKGLSALGLRGIEMISPLVRGQFRILMFGRKDDETNKS